MKITSAGFILAVLGLTIANKLGGSEPADVDWFTEYELQAVFFPAGARALPAGNPKTSQEILTKAADKCFFGRKMIPYQ